MIMRKAFIFELYTYICELLTKIWKSWKFFNATIFKQYWKNAAAIASFYSLFL